MSHLSISAVREGTEPPGTDVVPDANLSTLGVLGWRRLGETAAGDSNYRLGQLLFNTGFAGASTVAATPPTGWVNAASAGTRSVTAIDLGQSMTLTATAARQWDYFLTPVVSGSTYCYSYEVLADGVLTIVNMGYATSDTGTITNTAFRVDGVTQISTYVPPAGTHTIEAVYSCSVTGNVLARMGVGTSASTTGTATFKYPQFEVGSRRTSYNYNTSTTLAKAALWNGTIADIGSPAWGYYGGSTDKQASLASYVDGYSPVSSAGARGWRGTSVVGAGLRITIPLLGQSVRVKLGTGAYDGTHRIAVSLSDSSAGAVSSDQVSGAATVGWWRTDVLACATSDAANLVIDITHISGAGNACQVMWMAAAFGTPVIKSIDEDTFHEGGTSVVQIAGFAILPLTANSLLAGLGITIASATHLTATLTMPTEANFRFGGTWAAVGWMRDKTLTIANASESASLTTAQIQPQYSDQYAARSGDMAAHELDAYNTDKTVLLGDPVYMWTDPVEMATIDASVMEYTPFSGDPLLIYGKFFDEDLVTWSGVTTWEYPEPDAPGGGTLSISGSQESIKPPGVLVPNSYNLTAYGDTDWVKAARTAAATYDTKSGGTIIAAPANIGTPAWVRNVDGDSTSDPLVTWTDGAELGSYTSGDRYVQYTTVLAAGQRWVISPAGALRQIYLIAGTYQGYAHVDVSFSDSSAPAVRYDLTSESGIYEVELIEILAQPLGGAATITIDLILDGGFSVGWAALMVGTGSPEALYSLTNADLALIPGQTTTVTLVGGPFPTAADTCELIYGELSVTAEFTQLTPSTFSVTMPSIEGFIAGGSNEFIPFFANFTIRLSAGEATADSPNTNQFVPESDGQYGISFATRQLPAELSPYFYRTSKASDTSVAGVLSVVNRSPNGIAYTDDLSNAYWTKETGVTVTANATSMSVGTKGMSLITGMDNEGIYKTLSAQGTIEDPIGVSFRINKNGIASGTFRVINTPQAAYGQWTVDLALVGAGEQLITRNHPAVTVNYPFKLHTAGAGGFFFHAPAGALAPFYIGGVQHQVGVTDDVFTEYFHHGDNALPVFDGDDGLILERAKTNRLYNTGFAGATTGTPGAIPTGWQQSQSGGTQTVVSSAMSGASALRWAVAGARHNIWADLPGLGVGTYVGSAVVTVHSATSPGAQLQALFLPLAYSCTFGTITYRVNGVSQVASYALPVGGTYVVEVIIPITVSGQAFFEIGPGRQGNNTSDVTCDLPQFESGYFRSGYIYNVATGSVLTRTDSYLGPILLANLGLTPQTNEYSGQLVVKAVMDGGTAQEASYYRLLCIGATASSTRLEITANPNSERVFLSRFDAGVQGTEVSTSASQITWAKDDIINFRWSWGATDGLIFVISINSGANVVRTSAAAGAKSAAVAAMTHVALNAQVISGVASTAGEGWIYQGFRIWDTAKTQTELEALTAEDCVQIGKFGILGAPEWGYSHPVAQELDDVYGYQVSGDPMNLIPESLDVESSGTSVGWFHIFNQATARWLDPIYVRTGTATASDALVAYLLNRIGTLALGANVMSKEKIKIARSTLTRPANTTAYAVGDALSAVTTDNMFSFLSPMGSGNGMGIIRRATLRTDKGSLSAAPGVTLYFFGTAITETVDNAAFSPSDTDINLCCGVYSFEAADWKVLPNNAIASLRPDVTVSLRDAADTVTPGTLYVQMVFDEAYTPASGEIWSLELELEPL